MRQGRYFFQSIPYALSPFSFYGSFRMARGRACYSVSSFSSASLREVLICASPFGSLGAFEFLQLFCSASVGACHSGSIVALHTLGDRCVFRLCVGALAFVLHGILPGGTHDQNGSYCRPHGDCKCARILYYSCRHRRARIL